MTEGNIDREKVLQVHTCGRCGRCGRYFAEVPRSRRGQLRICSSATQCPSGLKATLNSLQARALRSASLLPTTYPREIKTHPYTPTTLQPSYPCLGERVPCIQGLIKETPLSRRYTAR